MYLDTIADWIPEIVEMGRLPYPVKSGKVAYISRDDLARATAAALTGEGHSEKTYELTGAEALSMERLAGIISEVTGRPVRFDSITDEEYGEICRTGDEEVPEFLIPMLTTLYHAVDNGEFELVTDHVEKLTGRPPQDAASFLRSALDL
jgi:NAD(P)H dehydrogenase (quinone)